MKSGGVRLKVLMKRVAVGRTTGGGEQAITVGITPDQMPARVAHVQDEQEAVGGHHRKGGAGRYRQ